MSSNRKAATMTKTETKTGGGGGKKATIAASAAQPPQQQQQWRTNAIVKQPPGGAGGTASSTTATAATPAVAGGGGAAGTAATRKGALMLKTVSLFLASSRRASTQVRIAESAATAAARKAERRSRKMDESTGKLNPRQLETLKKRTHFNQRELEGLALIFRNLVVSSNATSRALAANSVNAVIPKTHATVDGVDSNCFCELLHSTFDIVVEDLLMERIFVAWQRDHELQPLKLEPFLCGLSVFLRGTPAERMSFCFRVYDINADGFISRDEMFTLLKNCLIHPPQEEDPDEAVREWMEIILRKMDGDSDGRISLEDYTQAVTADPLLMEAFGQCLPTRHAAISFLATI